MKTKILFVFFMFFLGTLASQSKSMQIGPPTSAFVTWNGDVGTCSLNFSSAPVAAIIPHTGVSYQISGQTNTFTVTREAFQLFGSSLRTYIVLGSGIPHHPFDILCDGFIN